MYKQKTSRRKKFLALLLAVLMALSIAPIMSIAENEKIIDLNISDLKVFINNVEVNPAAMGSAPMKLANGANIRIEYKWNAVKYSPDIHNGDYSLIPIFAGFPVKGVPSATLTGPDESAPGKIGEIGTLELLPDGNIKIVYNNKLEGKSDIKGSASVATYIDFSLIQSEETVTIPIQGDQGFQFIVGNPVTPAAASIRKIVAPSQQASLSANDPINWQVDVNTSRKADSSGIIVDEIKPGANHEFPAPVNIEVKKLDSNGNPTGLPLTSAADAESVVAGVSYYVNRISDKQIKVYLAKPGDTISDAYRLTYATKATETGTGKTYNNTATIVDKDNGTKEITHSDAAYITNSVVSPSKTGVYYANVGNGAPYIEWTVIINPQGATLNSGNRITVSDTIVGDHTLDTNSFKLAKITYNAANGTSEEGGATSELWAAESANSLNVIGLQTFTFTLPDKQGYKLMYRTNVTANAGAYDAVNTYKNRVTVTGSAEVEGTAGIHNGDRGPDDIFAKNVTASNDIRQTVSWRAAIYPAGGTLNNAVYTDIFDTSADNAPMKLVPSTLKVVKRGTDSSIETPLASPGDYSLTYLDGESDYDKGFKVTFNDNVLAGNSLYLIYYDTEYRVPADGKTYTKVTNGGKLTYNGDSKEGSASHDLPRSSTQNGSKSGTIDNDSQLITWTVEFNSNKRELGAVKVTDQIRATLSYIVGSLKVYDLNSGVAVEITKNSSKYTATEPGGLNKTLTVNFAENGFYRIVYQTKLIAPQEKTEYSNTATITPGQDSTYSKFDLTASVTYDPAGKYLSKSANVNGKDIGWSVIVNKDKADLSNVSVTDTLSRGQILTEDSIRVYKDSISPMNRLGEGKDYSLVVEPRNITNYTTKFTVTFKDSYSFNDKHIIVYSSKIDDATLLWNSSPGKNDYVIENNTTLTADEISSVPVEVKEDRSWTVINGNVSGVSPVPVTLRKVDAKNPDVALSGAVFVLKDIEKNKQIAGPFTTGNDGTVYIGEVLPGTYTLEETVAPAGYVLSDYSKQTIQITGTDPIIITIKNIKANSGDVPKPPVTPPDNPPYNPPVTPPVTPPATPPTDPPSNIPPSDNPTPPITENPDTPPPPAVPGDTVEKQDDGSYLEIGDDGVPRGKWHHNPDTGDWEFEEFPPPLADFPATGDSAFIIGYVIAALMAAAGIVVLTEEKKKNR